MAAPNQRPGPELEGYTWVQALGSGGFADVHLYRQRVPDRDVAIKVVRNIQDLQGARELRREANAMALVSGHPAVVELYAVGTTTDGRPYLVMEYCPVSDVGAQVRTRPMAVDKALDTIIRLCGGVEMLHRSGMVHRDIKPANVMMDSYGKPVLTDFGVTSGIGALEAGALDGFSVLWAPPEQHDSRTHAHPTQDVWALASTAWTLLAGRSPFEDPIGDNSAVAIANRVREGRMRALGRADAPPQLEAALRAAMTLDPLARTPSAAELGRALQKVQEIMGRPVTPMELRDDTARPGSTGPAGAYSGADEGTRLRGMASIDAERTRMSSMPVADFSAAAPGPQADRWRGAETTSRSVEQDDDEDLSSRRRGMHPLAIVALVLVAVLGAAGLVVALLTEGGQITLTGGGSSTTTEEETSLEEIAAPAPAPVTGLAGVIRDGQVHWSWTPGRAVDPNATPVDSAQSAASDGEQSAGGAQSAAASSADDVNAVRDAGDVKNYLYTATRPGQEDITATVTTTEVSIDAVSGENCLEVVAVGEGGRQSTSVKACVAVP